MSDFNPFLFQVLISNVPTVLTNGFIPILGSSFGTSLVSLGVFFFLMRFGNVVGSIISPLIHNRFLPHKIGTISELLFFVTTSLILFSVIIKSIELFIICAFFKGVIGGSISILRFSWLKQFPNYKQSSHLNLLANVLIQGSYCLVGIFLFIAPSLETAKIILFLDAIGSLFGALIFWKMKKFSSKPNNVSKNKYKEMITSLISTPSRRIILFTDILVCCGLGGTNIMLFKYGDEFFGKEYGYAITLILYGIFYFIGGKIIELKNKNKEIRLNEYSVIASLIIMIFSLILIMNTEIFVVKIISFSLIFLFYPLVNLQINSEWFRLCKPQEAAGISSAEIIYSQIILGVFEIIYGYMIYDNFLRVIFLITAIIFMLFYSVAKKNESEKSLTFINSKGN
ncbi:hypothetical protein GCL60_11790 [Silvanigrella paludirubra]|uniref:MFS transporter n=1 Tax=Silvanigrella paludirubra TaxID=2499159 RepID=A0A6N6VQI2_9BACT|nr:hypothetical protein [Silvanigrella paludirubra]KAB8037849.1 hypothetical protein GCL60_11790 [Silvanigrella paludirubra]